VTEDTYELARLLRSAAMASLHFLTHGDASTELASRETEFHHGDDPIQADLDAQRHFAEAVRDHAGFEAFKITAIVGEENIENVPPHSAGARIIVVDPLDGSRPWTIARIGYCVAALLLHAPDDEKWEVEAALIATPTEAFTLLGTDLLLHGPLSGEPETDLVVGSVVPLADVMPKSLAAVAYKPEDRAAAMRIVARLPDWAFISLGGNPLTPYVVVGRLTAVVTLKPSSTWDSVGVLMAAATDAVVGDHAGQRLSGPDFRRLFAQVLLTGNVTPIPALVVAKSQDTYLEVVNAIQQVSEASRGYE
jgi:hypothetical protein